MEQKHTNATTQLIDNIIDVIINKKGKHVLKLDFTAIQNSVCKYFIICHGDSNIHVTAIAEAIEERVEEKNNEKVWKREGLENAQWVLLDYVDVVVHVFQKSYRDFYNLEDLWADAAAEVVEESLNY